MKRIHYWVIITIQAIIIAGLIAIINPSYYQEDSGIYIYSKLADNSWDAGYNSGMEVATQDASDYINGDDNFSYIYNLEKYLQSKP